MGEALKGVAEQRRAQPPGLVTMRISSQTGLAARPGEPDAAFEYFMAGHLPPQPEGEGTPGAIEGGSSGESRRDESLF
jgi:penicillin-binding protein 1A